MKLPELGTKMYFVLEHLYYDKSIRTAPLLEYCVCEGTVRNYIKGGYTEMVLIGQGADHFQVLSYFRIGEIGNHVFFTPYEAALLAKKMTEDYERTWAWIGDAPLRRSWAHLLEADTLC